MPAKHDDLYGSVPDTSSVALVLIDLINDLEFEGGERMLSHLLRVAPRIAALKAKARKRHVPVIYANDNFGRWRSDFRQAVTHCLQDGVRGGPVVELLKPAPEDYFVLKVRHSAFFSTALERLLRDLKARRIVLTGVSGDMCVLLTAADAYMRDLELYVPGDCVGSISAVENRQALRYMERVFKADTRPSSKLDFAKLRRR